MTPSVDLRREAIRTCLSDLRAHGIELVGADQQRLADTVHEHLDYFQLMLGSDPPPREIVGLLLHETRPVTGRVHRA